MLRLTRARARKVVVSCPQSPPHVVRWPMPRSSRPDLKYGSFGRFSSDTKHETGTQYDFTPEVTALMKQTTPKGQPFEVVMEWKVGRGSAGHYRGKDGVPGTSSWSLLAGPSKPATQSMLLAAQAMLATRRLWVGRAASACDIDAVH